MAETFFALNPENKTLVQKKVTSWKLKKEMTNTLYSILPSPGLRCQTPVLPWYEGQKGTTHHCTAQLKIFSFALQDEEPPIGLME